MRYSFARRPHGPYWVVVDHHRSDAMMGAHVTASSAVMEALRLEEDWRRQQNTTTQTAA